ncbi:hypothetical protein ACFL1H_07540 [Nanoarchaeota archaeon]
MNKCLSCCEARLHDIAKITGEGLSNQDISEGCDYICTEAEKGDKLEYVKDVFCDENRLTEQGALIMAWGQSFFESELDSADKISSSALSCSYIQDIDVRRITYDNDYTASNGHLTILMFMAAEPRVKIQELTIFIQNENQFLELSVDDSKTPNLVPFNLGSNKPITLEFEINRNDFDGDINSLTIIPEIDVDDQEESRPCNQRSREITDQEDELENI